MASSTTKEKELLTDLSPVLRVYTDGTVERCLNIPHVPPSPEDPTTGVSSKDLIISSSVSARIYLPKLTATALKLPILVYYHGGGFCLGSAFSSFDQSYLNIFSAEAGAIVVSVDYRIAPEHPLPAAYEDSWEALKWVCSHALHQTNIHKDHWIADHGDFSRIFVAGDSAGGNIAHNIALRAGSESPPGNVKILGAVLSHPYFMGSDPIGNESRENKSWALLEKMWLLVYPSAPGGIDNHYINPLADGAPSLSGLGCSRIQICVSEKDVLTGRAMAYAAKVRNSGWAGEVEVVEVEGEDHCFHVFDPQSHNAMILIKKMASFVSLSK